MEWTVARQRLKKMSHDQPPLSNSLVPASPPPLNFSELCKTSVQPPLETSYRVVPNEYVRQTTCQSVTKHACRPANSAKYTCFGGTPFAEAPHEVRERQNPTPWAKPHPLIGKLYTKLIKWHVFCS
ncbi:unnamed protein product [Caenorhabditis auriculariae]|uniref:Uncharacterized protein n=1 Tax=Caenorhabditis auriculariae TaxID=2777116 RepID=A0A8S1HDR7_9PELO|nr:unnamed protein product [Caenorhabditis auriculariae]